MEKYNNSSNNHDIANVELSVIAKASTCMFAYIHTIHIYIIIAYVYIVSQSL